MFDFLTISTRSTKKDRIEIFPKFIIKKSNDLMIRGGDFYAVWLEDRGLWSTDEEDVINIIDAELDKFKAEHQFECDAKVLHMWDSSTGMIDSWHKYCQKQMRDSFHMLDEKIIFSNQDVKKRDYATRKLEYPLEKGAHEAYDALMNVLYSPEEKEKLEWAIGSIVDGDSKKIQKFCVLYGAAGTGKSTVLNIIQQLFEGYYSVFDARALGSSSNVFALEAFKTNPLVAIQHDGDLSRIEDNTRLNSLVSHEMMTVNEKFKSTYTNRFKAFLFMGTNKPVKITDGKSGLIRRLIDVSPSGNKVSSSEYKKLVKQIPFELGAIAAHCLEVYQADPDKYDDYIPTNMLGATNDFYGFVEDNYWLFKKSENVTLKQAWELYQTYCNEAKVLYPLNRRTFKEELKTYFKEFEERSKDEEGARVRSYYIGFRTERFEKHQKKEQKVVTPEWLRLSKRGSLLDEMFKDCPAQYSNDAGTPQKRWSNCKTRLSDIDTSKTHYLKPPSSADIVVDFDLKNENGEKDLDLNLKAAAEFPKTYAELSQGGNGLHLHYIYDGDTSELSSVYAPGIEIKVFTGDASLRRRVSKCNDIPVAIISSGLPRKEKKKVVNVQEVKSERSLRTLILRNMNKEILAGTKPSMDFIKKILEDAYNSSLSYDISDMRGDLFDFASNSTHHAEYCMDVLKELYLKSKDREESQVPYNVLAKLPWVFFDVEVYPNLFLICWKLEGLGKPVVKMFNPTPEQVEEFIKMALCGFNCRRYDNHMVYAAMLGYSNIAIFNLSQSIVAKGDRNSFFPSAYNISKTDVFDFAATKQSLKKWEIELIKFYHQDPEKYWYAEGLEHDEMFWPWDEPVPEELWERVGEYCAHDVIATEALFNHLKGDFRAREILADLACSHVNDTTNNLTTKIIKNGDPKIDLQYRFMGDESKIDWEVTRKKVKDIELYYPQYTVFDSLGRPIFPGYEYKAGKSTYRDICPDNPDKERQKVGEGGLVYAEPGMYVEVDVEDISGMHPASIIAEELFGEHTANFQDIVMARTFIKHGELNKAKKMLGGKLAPYLDDPTMAKDLAQALKIAVNSVYGLTSAKFDNAFRDKRNVDNIVAKRGALFMINLRHEVQARGFTVAHIKTDSIKIPNATPEIISFVREYGKLYGYSFETEHVYDRLCLVNRAVYIAKQPNGKWDATGEQFAVPYVYKTMFSKEPLTFDDFCETKSVDNAALYLDINEDLPEGEENLKFVGKIGQFTPIKPGCGGGILYRKANEDGKMSAATGSKGYRWLESEFVRKLPEWKELIDYSYFNNLVDDAKDTIRLFGDYEWFVSENEEPPFEGAHLVSTN